MNTSDRTSPHGFRCEYGAGPIAASKDTPTLETAAATSATATATATNTATEIEANSTRLDIMGAPRRGSSKESVSFEADRAPPRSVLPFEANQELHVIKYKGEVVWSRSTDVAGLEALPEGYATYRLDELITGKGEECELNIDTMKAIINDVKEEWRYARYIAGLTHLDRPKVTDRSEMYYQQHVYPPISGILGCFRSDFYAANQLAHSGFCCSSLTLSSGATLSDVPFTCTPDAACLGSEQAFVLGMMELKHDSVCGLDRDDFFNCVLLTSITAVAMVEGGVAETVFVPFVIGGGEVARVFVTTFMRDSRRPEVKQLPLANLYWREDRVRIVALLALLLHKLTKLLDTSEGTALTLRLDIDMNQKRSTPRRSSESDNARPKKKGKGGNLGGTGATQGTSDAGMIDAQVVATCEGNIAALAPFHEGGRDSPYYFLGEWMAPADAASCDITNVAPSPVFIKVWREGDERSSRRNIESEINLQTKAHCAGVPCPRVVTKLTRLSIDYSDGMYHRLVMCRLADHVIGRRDLHAYAVSLIAAVDRLHQACILHCDIKPSNVVWDATTKIASLVDFGHAQKDEDAIGYMGTEGFTAPEVERKLEPHSRQSDAYSVGKTILKAYTRALGGTPSELEQHCVARVALLLTRGSPEDRITLDGALDLLKSSRVAATPDLLHQAVHVSPESAELKRGVTS